MELVVLDAFIVVNCLFHATKIVLDVFGLGIVHRQLFQKQIFQNPQLVDPLSSRNHGLCHYSCEAKEGIDGSSAVGVSEGQGETYGQH